MMKLLVPLFLQLFCLSEIRSQFNNTVSNHANASDGLILLHVLHRHGARTRDEETYPNDPHLKETFSPFGYAQLTNEGKLGIYRLGQSLRARYDSFLGDIYYPDLLEARCSDTNRTKMSIQLTLAGLFPPRGSLVWNENLAWQPIPYNYYSENEDFILGKPKKYCPKYKKLLKKYRKGDGSELFEEDLKVYEYCSNRSGLEIKHPDTVYDLYKTLLLEEEWGLQLPDWTSSVWKDKLVQAAIKKFTIRTGTKKLKRLAAGFFLKKLIDDTRRKIAGTLTPQNRKFFLYSAHEANIAAILRTFDLFDSKIPTYGSHLIFEVRLINGIYGLQIYYQNYQGDDPQLLTVPGCDSFCPVDTYAELLEDFIPESESECDT